MSHMLETCEEFVQVCTVALQAMQLATVHLPAALFQVLWQGKTLLDQTQKFSLAAANHM